MASSTLQQERDTINGISLPQLEKTTNAFKQDPEKAKFQFRTETTWKGGLQNETSIQSFRGFGTDDTSRGQPFMLQDDHPAVLLGENKAPTPIESFLHALASCLNASFVAKASAKGIQINSLSFDLEGDLDVRGFLGLDKSVRPGCTSIRATCNVKADASREQIKELCDQAQESCPVMDMIKNPVDVQVQMG